MQTAAWDESGCELRKVVLNLNRVEAYRKRSYTFNDHEVTIVSMFSGENWIIAFPYEEFKKLRNQALILN